MSSKMKQEDIEKGGEPGERVELLNHQTEEGKKIHMSSKRLFSKMEEGKKIDMSSKRLFSKMEELKDKKRRAKRFLNEMAQRNDFVLRGEKDKKDQQEVFIKKLKEKQIEVEKEELDGSIFYGLRASEEALKDNQFLSKESDPNKSDDVDSKCLATRIRFVDSILKETKINTVDNTGEGLQDLMNDGVFETKFCLHECLLQEERKEKRRWTKRFLNEMAQWNDFVLVGEKDKKDQQEVFIKKLKEKQIEVVEVELDGNILYGLRAKEEVHPSSSAHSGRVLKINLCFSKTSDPNKSDDVDGKCLETRIRFVHSILKETKIDTGDGLEDLMKKRVFEIKFCFYEEELKEKKRRAKRFLNEMARENNFVLVGKKDKKDQQKDFIKKLEEKQIEVKEKELDDKIFYGLQARDEVIKKKLNVMPDSTSRKDVKKSITLATRIRFVNSVLKEKEIDTGDGLEDLMKKRVFKTKFCSHEALLTEYYYILVGPKGKEGEQKDFIEELKRKNIKVKKITREEQIFYGLRAEETVFKKYQHLLKVSDTCNSEDMKTSISLATRIRIVHFILKETKTNKGEGLKDLKYNGVFKTFYCLHEENHQEELKEWADWKKAFNNQPFKKIRKYFGEKVALYYLWMGWYTTFLIPAGVVGLLVFLCGIAFFDTHPLIKEVCDSNITMCPRCEKVCDPWNLKDTCTYAKVSFLFDNNATVAFALFMAGWATTLLELWKRYRAKQVSKWEVYDWNEEEEELILEVINDPECEPKKFKHSYLWNTLLLVVGTLIIMAIIGLTSALVVFRVSIRPLLVESSWEFISENTNTLVSILGAVLHYITIQIMTQVNRWVSQKLSELDKSNSRFDREKTFTIMMFTFQFFTLFSSLFYIAFFLGRINGHPGNYLRIAGQRLEECHPSGCLTNLFIQMFVIMTLSQFFSNIAELTRPWLTKQWRKVMTTKDITLCDHKISIHWPKKQWRKVKAKMGSIPRQNNSCRNEDTHDKLEHWDCWNEKCDDCLHKYWQENYDLADTDDYSLFHEILKMVIQFSFTTLFVAAFPLAPLMALINNIITIRLAAIKMVRLQRLLIPKKTTVIGVWTNVLEAIGVLAVITNGLVIGVTSEFIPRLVYRYGYGPCAMGVTNTHCMSGYINSTLTTAYMFDNNPDEFVPPKQRHLFNVTECSFRGYRNPDDHSLTSQFWWVLAARFIFIIAFEHLLLVFKAVAAWFVPSDSVSVKNDRVKSKLGRLKREQEKNKSGV